MVNVECPGCGATYSVAEKRIPEQGLRMRCPKCSESFVVDRPKQEGEPAGLPRLAQPRPGAQAPTRRGHGEPALFDKGPKGAPVMGGASRQVASAGAPVPPPEKPPLFAPPKTGTPDTEDIDAGFGEDGFGVIDLSLPDPPPPASFPGAAAEPAHWGDDLPMVAESDLPMAALPHDDLPLLAVDDLPARAQPRAPVPPPRAAPTQKYTPGHDDLPMPAASDLPVVAPRPDDLPMRARRHDDLPAVAQSNLPVPAARGGHADLPVARSQSDLPVPQAHLPVARGPGDLPVPAAGLPIPADQDLPLPSPSGDLPLPADFNFPTRIGMNADDDIPMSDGETPPPRMRASRDTAPSAGNQARDDAAFLNQGQFPSFSPELTSVPPHQAPMPAPPPGRPDEVGREFEMEPASFEPEKVSSPAKADAPRVRIKPHRSRALRTTLIVIPAIAIFAGVVPYVLGYGPYAYFPISDSLNRADNERAFESFRDGARVQLDNDTAAEARAALEQARAQQNQMPRFEPMKGYAAYLAYLMVVRFGESQSKATGVELLANVPPDAATEAVALARAAQAAADGQYPEARAQLDVLLSSKPDDLDALTLSGLTALAQNDAKVAHERFTKAVAIAKTARTLYGLARAEHALGHGAEAEKLAEQVLSLSKSHAGARVLAATVRWQRDRRDERAVKLLEEAVNDAAVRGAASASELVKAYSLLGTIHVSQGRYGAAEKAFAEALKLDAQSELALVGSGELFYAAGRYQEALARFEGAQRVNPGSVEAAAGMAKAKLALERPKEALLALKELAAKTKHPLLYFWWGQI
ncbi:MAG TPA: tetratricopeptide repeat protein, partial [Polyangiaceae bacterium]|nr:tetratricopeptide repeat protein [Polyangiaceae bacterium]